MFELSNQKLFPNPNRLWVQGFEIGSGFSGAAMLGSEHNDEFYMQGGAVRTRTNRSGGVQGGISNGEAAAEVLHVLRMSLHGHAVVAGQSPARPSASGFSTALASCKWHTCSVSALVCLRYRTAVVDCSFTATCHAPSAMPCVAFGRQRISTR